MYWFDNLTFTKCEKPGYAISQYPCVSAELEQIIRENVGKPETEPVRAKDQVMKMIMLLITSSFPVVTSHAVRRICLLYYNAP